MCLYGTYGCDDQESEEQCVESIFDTEGGSTTARYRPGDTDEEDISITAELTDKVTRHNVCLLESGVRENNVLLIDVAEVLYLAHVQVVGETSPPLAAEQTTRVVF